MHDSDAPQEIPTARVTEVPAGPLWKDRYLIERELGRGGVGIVYLARDQQLLSKPVVIKVPQDEISPDPYFQKKFQQEIEALARIDHPGVVGVLDVGKNPAGKPFLVMQFVEGVTLRSKIAAGGMNLGRVGNILRQVGQALGAAHDKGVFHRDLKPENIMLQPAGDAEEYVKLIDFGIAAVRDSQVVEQTQASKVVGTVSYMAPEQVTGQPSPTSDIYSLGVIAFEMLTGQRPEVSWQGVSPAARALRAAIPAAAEQIIVKALSYRPEERPARPRDFGEQIAAALGVESARTAPITAVPVGPSAPASSSSVLEMAYVLFMDLVAYSKLPMDLQSEHIQLLQQTVRGTAEFQRAQQQDQIISLPTGDGMALVFFQNPVAPIECATEISRALRRDPRLKVRMGLHTGPVYRIADINTNRNVAGGGMNLAQRVMDCGDAGHILVSKTVADILGQLSGFAPSLHDLGEVEVKHGVRISLVNFYTDDVGNPEMPERLRGPVTADAPAPRVAAVAEVPAAAPAPAPAAVRPAPPPEADWVTRGAAARSNAGLVGIVAAAVVVGGLAFVALKLWPWGRKPDAAAGRPLVQSGVGPSPVAIVPGAAAPAAEPPAAEPPTAAPPPSQPPPPAAAASLAPGGGIPPGPSGPAAAGAPPGGSRSALVTPSAEAPAPRTSPPAGTAAPRSTGSSARRAQAAPAAAAEPRSVEPAPGAAPAAGPGDSAQAQARALEEARERMSLLAPRAAAISRSMERMDQQQARLGVGMRADMAAARESMEYLLTEAKEAIEARDAEAGKRKMDLAERQVEKLERFLGR